MIKWILTYSNHQGIQAIEFDTVGDAKEYCTRNKIDEFKIELVTDIKVNDADGFAYLIEREMEAFNNRKVAN
jgi:hypothetical protein